MPTIKNRRAPASQWSTLNPVLAAGEIGYELDTNKFKIGNGLSRWNVLKYFLDEDSLIPGGRNPFTKDELPDRWKSIIGQRDSRSITGVITGSSTTAGAGAESNHRRFSAQLARMFQSSYNPSGIVGGESFRASDGNIGIALSSSPATTVVDTGLGLGARSLPDGAYLRLTRPRSTGFEIFFSQGEGSGDLTVKIDSEAPYTHVVDKTGPFRYDGRLKTRVLDGGNHSITLTAVGGKVNIDSIYNFIGDNNIGIRLLNNGKGGATMSTFIGSAPGAPSIRERMGQLKPDFHIVFLGSNELSAAWTADKTETEFEAFVQELLEIYGSEQNMPWIGLVAMPKRPDVATDYDGILRGIKAVAAKHPKYVSFHDLSSLFPKTQAEDNAWYDFIGTDNVHPTQAGHSAEADGVADLLDLPSRVLGALAPPTAEDVSKNPDQYETVALYDAASLSLADGAPVSSWSSTKGKAGPRPLTPLTAGTDHTLVKNDPLFNGQPSVHFAGAAGAALQSVSDQSFLGPTTTIHVIHRMSKTDNRTVFSATGDAPYSYTAVAEVSRILGGANRANDFSLTGPAPNDTPLIIATVFDGTNSKLYVNNVKTFIPVVMTANGIGVRDFRYGNNNSLGAPYTGALAFSQIFNKALTPAEIEQVVSPLASRFGIELYPNYSSTFFTSDDFAGASSNNVVGRTLNAALGGAQMVWKGSNNVLGIANGMLVRGSATDTLGSIYVEPVSADYEVGITIGEQVGDIETFLDGRRDPVSNFGYRVRLTPDRTTISLLKRTTGQTITLGGANVYPVKMGDKVALRSFGTQVSMVVNGTPVAVTKDTEFTAAGRAGLASGPGDNTKKFGGLTDFYVKNLTNP
ncbi:tail protein [Rhodococcus phage ReqiPoco6]|uniref:Tail fiber protein n=1 Tax=Rhodococcus phage ReqiPoco6 TaxID=691964 RepID=D4P7M4_9CAUD|nr:tail protein [Rhodococcus phage ReqiPoco6]ADD81004.1 tail fiber protein [Rhodococcus phage ReqiPoco6]